MNSPFKFLDPYSRGDRGIFFGRDRAIEDLYTLVLQTKLVLVYGMSGTGKTSIIQCGLASKFRDSDWLPLLIRRKDDINAATVAALAAAGRTPIAPGADIITAVRSVYLDKLRPVFLIFDQFEELFILGTAAERAIFFADIQKLLVSDLSFKIVISLREEYIAQLSSYEAVVPTLFEKRLRIEPMTPLFVKDVFNNTTAAFDIELEHPEASPPHPSTADTVIAQLADKAGVVELAYLQVYLDRLYRSAADVGTPIRFTDALIAQTGAIGDVMVKFLEEQVGAIKATMAASHHELGSSAVEAILSEFVTAEGTKQPLSLADLARRPLDLTPTVAEPQGWRKLLAWWRTKPMAQPVDIAAVVAEVTTLLETARILRLSGGQYELAHDCLAARAGALRGADRSAELGVEKLVKDVLFQFRSGRAKTYLNRDQLIEIRRFYGRLKLDSVEKSFVEDSRKRLRRRRVLRWCVVMFLLLAGFFWLGYSLNVADEKHQKLVDDFLKISQQELLPEDRLKIAIALFDEDTSKPDDSYNIAEKQIELGQYDEASKRLDEMSTRIADNSGAEDSQLQWWNYLYHFARGNIALGESNPASAVNELIAAAKAAGIDVTSPNHPPITSSFLSEPNHAEYLAAGLCQLAAAQHLSGDTSAATRTIGIASAVRAPLKHLLSYDNDKIFDRCDKLTDTLTASGSSP